MAVLHHRADVEEEATVAAGAVLVDGALDREEQIGLALHVVQGEPRGAPDEIPGRHPGAFADLQIVERVVEDDSR